MTVSFYAQFVSLGAETEIFLENEVNTMTADALAPCVART